MDLLNMTPQGGGQDNPTLDANLRALARFSPETAALIRQAIPRADVAFHDADDGGVGLSAGGRTIASKRRPLDEGERLAGSVDAGENAVACVLGFGAGHHCRSLGAALGGAGLIVCFEPDVGLLRAVFERIDHSEWLSNAGVSGARFVLLTNADDRAAIGRSLDGVEGLIALGAKIVPHPPSQARLGELSSRFTTRFTETVTSLKSVLATTLAQSGITLRNLLMNADVYAACDGIAPLAGTVAGRAAVVVSAGPSLARNLDQIAEPGVREKVVIVAVQTVLKPMLAAGVKPHIVCALDHHEISRRFYEGLAADDVEGITLVADPKVNPAVIEAWPGAVRFVANDLLDMIVGPGASGAKGELKPGATVAHLCHYIARYMGADPVILMGQDLGFTDGQYYAAGAAIHNVWAGELGPFCSIESMEWQRIARGKRRLIQREDVFGRPIFTDDQMASYLAQFEVDFAADARAGRRVLDATEGGVAKQNTTATTLAEALAGAPEGEAVSVPAPARADLGSAAPSVVARLGETVGQVERVGELSRETAALLDTMSKTSDHNRVNDLVRRVHAIRDEVTAIHPGWRLVQFLDQSGVLARIRSDRAIELDASLDQFERQRRQIERDRDNVERIAEAADQLAELLEQSRVILAEGRERVTRTIESVEGGTPAGGGRVEAVIPVDADLCGLGVERDLGAPVVGGLNALQMTVTRLLRAVSLDGVTLLSGEPDRAAALLGPLAADARVSIEHADGTRVRARMRAVGRARLFGPASWRGGIGGLTCYDEAIEPMGAADLCERREVDAAVVVGADWALIDPALVDAVINRWRESPESNRIVFTQAVPGLAPALLDRRALGTLREAAETGGAAASFGGLVAYLPHAPQPDPIGTRLCVRIDEGVRDAGARCTADTEHARERVRSFAESAGDGWIDASAAHIARTLGGARSEQLPRHIELELCTGRLGGGAWTKWRRGASEPVERPVMTLPLAHTILRQVAKVREDAVVTLSGTGDPMLHERALDVVTMASELGIGAVHLRTDLLREGIEPEALIESGASVISVDLVAGSAGTYHELVGVDRYDAVVERTGRLIELSRARAEAGLPTPWIVPRITRCDAVVPEIPDFVDWWLMTCGCVQIDPLPRAMAGARVGPLPVPTSARVSDAGERLLVCSDGRCAPLADGGWSPSAALDLTTMDLERVWRTACRVRREAVDEADELEPAGEPVAA